MVRKQDLNKADSEFFLEAEQKIALLQEQVETLNQELYEQSQVTQVYIQELENTNHELVSLERELQNTMLFKLITLNQAKEFAKNILKNKLPLRESLAELLSAIYYSPVAPHELEEADRSTPSIPAHKNTLVQNSKDNLTELRFQVNELNTKFNRLNAQIIQLQAIRAKSKQVRRLKAEKNDSISQPKSNYLDKATPPPPKNILKIRNKLIGI